VDAGIGKTRQGIWFLLDVDDIQVGCRRTGSLLRFDDMGIILTIFTLAKGIGGRGTPGNELVHPDLDKHWSPGEHTGNIPWTNLSFVAGAEALSYFETDK